MGDFGTDMANDERSENMYRDILTWYKKMGIETFESEGKFLARPRKAQREIWGAVRKEYLNYRAIESANEMNEKLGTNIEPMSDSDTTVTGWFKTWFPNVDK